MVRSRGFLLSALFFVALVLLIGITGCSSEQGASDKGNQASQSGQSNETKSGSEKQNFMTIGTAPQGAGMYSLGVGMAKIISDKAPGIKVTAQPTGASVENIKMIGNGEAEMGYAIIPTAYEAFQGKGTFDKPYPMLRMLFVTQDVPHYLVVREDSGINSWQDLKGKKIAAFPVSSSSARDLWNTITAKYGLQNSVNAVPVTDLNSTVQQIKDGNLDGLFYPRGSATTDLMSSIKVKWIPVDKQLAEEAVKENPAFAFATRVDPSGALFPEQKDDFVTIGNCSSIVIDEKIDEETAYKIVKAIFDNLSELEAVHPDGKWITLERATSSKLIPYHPGAIKYFKEKGVWKD